ncbi:oxygen sensor histidine kinase NreB [Streptomyces jeddahensis]|uniref:histidine kinase n=1 Tax=Streptomyces jeddahensis TaxID=1716141 RepID=A0A177HK88_9ACTN|nr:oxygen sensor histidine kinase NreB [Streptomyces jeddahensis]
MRLLASHTRQTGTNGGLTPRMIVASGLLMALVGAAFAVLLFSVADLRGAQRLAQQSEKLLMVANHLERRVVDLETGVRGFALTGQERFLQPWQEARAAFPEQASELERLAGGNAEQQARARRIERDGTSYIRDYSLPLVNAARRNPDTARTVAATEEGKRRVDAIRAEFDRVVATERDLAAARQRHSDAAADRAVVAAVVGLTGSVVLITVFAGYLTRAIVRPVRRAAAMAGRLAGGDLAARMPETGVGEIRVLERSFNAMASWLEEGRAELATSRARILAAADRARRRIERDLHDSTQQRLVAVMLQLRSVQAAVPPDMPEFREKVARVADALTGALDDLREVARGIHPAILSEGGLPPALKALARRSLVPVELEVDVPTRLPEPVEVAAYYVVSEALANTAKHARASLAHVQVRADEDGLHLSVRDDGVGGAAPGRGSGLVGLTDRIQALGGTIMIHSPAGQGTTLRADLPLTGP